MRLNNLQLYVQVLTRGKLMQIKVYLPNGKELSIHTEKINVCPLCHKLALIENINENGEGVDLFCYNCNLEFTSFSLRNFIKLRGFKEL